MTAAVTPEPPPATPRQRFRTIVGRPAPIRHGAPPDVGTIVDGRYALRERIGAGAMAQVFRAQRVRDGVEVALKVLVPDLRPGQRISEELRRRFEREALATSELSHEHIVEILDFGYTGDGRPFLVLELLEGETLADIIDRGEPLNPARAAHLGLQIASALREAHAQHIVHRDLKPDNVFVTCDPAGVERVKVVDFGIARVRDPRIGRAITARHALLGTPHYMSPEHMDAANAGPPSDVYSFGCLLWELLTGATPFEDDDHLAIMLAHLNDPVPRLEVPGLGWSAHASWRRLLAPMLAKAPAERPHMDAVLEQLVRLAPRPTAARFRSGSRARRRNTDPTVLLKKARASERAARAGWLTRAAQALVRAARGLVGSDAPA